MRAIAKYLKNRKKEIIIILEKPRKSYTLSTTHKLRVEIKKLKAFLEVIEFCAKDFDRKKSLRLFKLIFQQAGQVRELQVEEEMLKKYFANHMPTEYRDNLRRVRLKAQNDFFAIVDRKFISALKKQFRKISTYIDQINPKKGEKYLDSRRKEIEKLIQHIPLEEPKVHELRKLLKKYNYNQKCLDVVNHNKPQGKKDILSDLMGKWHDHQVTLEHLEKALATENVGEVKQLDEVRMKIAAECDELFNHINQAISESEFSSSKQLV